MVINLSLYLSIILLEFLFWSRLKNIPAWVRKICKFFQKHKARPSAYAIIFLRSSWVKFRSSAWRNGKQQNQNLPGRKLRLQRRQSLLFQVSHLNEELISSRLFWSWSEPWPWSASLHRVQDQWQVGGSGFLAKGLGGVCIFFHLY